MQGIPSKLIPREWLCSCSCPTTDSGKLSMLQAGMSCSSQEKSCAVFVCMTSGMGVRWDSGTLIPGMACAGNEERVCDRVWRC